MMPFCFSLHIQVGVGKAALRPMLMGDDIAGLGREIRMPFAAPFAAGEAVPLHNGALCRVGMIPVFIIARLPAAMGHDDNLNPRTSDGLVDAAKIVEQPDRVGYRFTVDIFCRRLTGSRCRGRP